jgi:hypothetical protein
MKITSLWIIRLALTVQFVGVLAVPALVAAGEAPRATWMADWLRPNVAERTIGVLKIRDGKLSFIEQIGQVDWELDLSNVKHMAVVNGGRALAITSVSGEEFVVSIMDSNLSQESPKKAIAIIERAVQTLATNGR